MNLLSALKMTCREATYLHEKKRDGKLSLSESIGLWWHTVICRFCAFFFKQIEHIEAQSCKMCEHAEQNITLSPAQKETLQKAFEQHLKQ